MHRSTQSFSYTVSQWYYQLKTCPKVTQAIPEGHQDSWSTR